MNPQEGSLQRKTSFYYPLLLLPHEKRKALEHLYRFCWAADEISDGPGDPRSRRKELAFFREELASCFKGEPKTPLFRNLKEVRVRFGLTREPLFRILQGVERDLRPVRFRAFSELHRYCLQVAGGPGLASMEIFGFKDKAYRDYAENLGIFLQLVNMTRDLREDLGLGRRYFPEEDYRRFGLDGTLGSDGGWKPFVRFQLKRAWSYLERSRASLTRRQRASLPVAEAIASVYTGFFDKLMRDPGAALEGKISLSRASKLFRALAAAGRCLSWRWTAG